MKITQVQVKAAYDRLLSDPSSSIRKLAKEYGVSEGCLRARLKKYLGTQYDRLNPPQGSLAKLLRQEILPSLTSDQRTEVTRWMNQNYDLLAQGSGLLTSAQEDRLTFTECLHSKPLDEMISLSSFLSARIQEGFTYVPFNPEAVTFLDNFQENESAPSLPSSYISVTDLEEVLADYFNFSLDQYFGQFLEGLDRKAIRRLRC